ncbi:MAG: glutamate-5-semialdehyde dehydrogenase [Elusimicrobia bacterium]|nr:glutamate-5-semialdehyde dehydrogenase [Elusimicrobiota bacterium]
MTLPVKDLVLKYALAAKKAAHELSIMSAEDKNKILLNIADALEENSEKILFHNAIDVDAAKQSGLDAALIDRLTLTAERVKAMAKGVRDVAKQADPIGEIISENEHDGLSIKKVRVPLGVICMIYESRPNVTADSAALCLKAGNAVILKGGSEAINSNKIISGIIVDAGVKAGLPQGAVQFIDSSDREIILNLIKLNGMIDLIIPRGSENLITFVREHSSVPVLSHGKGLCHVYIDKNASVEMATDIAFNAKCQRAGVCNAMETLLIHKDIAPKILPKLCGLYASAGTELRGCNQTQVIVPNIIPATEEDWDSEYHALILSVKIVNSLEEAISHVNIYGSQHSDAIVTNDENAAEKFIKEVDSSAVFHNASTRLHDGSVFGLGAEIGISTDKLHARGVMGVRELTSSKYIVRGDGNIRK